MRGIIYIAMLGLSVGLFFFYVHPTYQEKIKVTRAEIEKYDQVIEEAQNLIKRRDELIRQRNSIPPQDLDRLVKLLPDTVDTVRLIFDLDRIAARYGMVIRKVQIGDEGGKENGTFAGAFESQSKDYGTMQLSFTVTSEYGTFINFIRDLEDSLRISDITEINFNSESEDGLSDYTITIKTYWLK